MNYHKLPCGTVIPPEGIEAWVRDQGEQWGDYPSIIIANTKAGIMTASCTIWAQYSLTDPTKPKKRLVTPMELAGKWLHFNTGLSMMVVGYDCDGVSVRNSSYMISVLPEYCSGYSDTPNSEIKSFWVEDV